MSVRSRLSFGGVGSFELRPLCIKGDLKNITEYWHRFSDQLEWKQGDESSTALHEAARRGYYEIVEYLLDKGAKVNVPTSTGKTALFLAAEGCHTNCEVLLFHRGASVYPSPHVGFKSCLDTADGNFLKILTGLAGECVQR